MKSRAWTSWASWRVEDAEKQDQDQEANDRETFGRFVHPIGCICEGCSATYERERMDPRG